MGRRADPHVGRGRRRPDGRLPQVGGRALVDPVGCAVAPRLAAQVCVPRAQILGRIAGQSRCRSAARDRPGRDEVGAGSAGRIGRGRGLLHRGGGADPVRRARLDDPLSFKVYQPDRLVLGKRMEDHLRIAVCLWHSFNWPGSDVFGTGTFDRPWLDPRLDPMIAARAKLDAAFEFLAKLGVPFFCFHDRDIAPEGRTFAETRAEPRGDDRRGRGAHGPDRRASCCGARPTCSAIRATRPGAATNPDPEVFAYAAAQVKVMLEATHRLGGANYVLWGGREGYETLLNTDLAREEAQFARFLAMVAEHKHRIGFKGPAPHRAEAPGADQAPVRLRLRDRPRLPRPPRPGRRVPGQHRGEPRHPGRAQLPPRGRLRRRQRASSAASTPTAATTRTAGTPTSSRTRSTSSRWRSTRSSAPAGSRPAASTSTPSSAARAWTGPTCSMATSAGSTPSPARSSSPRR